MRDCGIQHLVNVSGGKDSTAVYLRAIELGRPFRAVFADTGNEDQRVYDYIAELPGRTGGPVVETVRADFSRQLAQHREYLIKEWPAELIAGRPGHWSFRRRRETQAEFAELAEAVKTGGTISWTLEPTVPKPDDGNVFDGWRASVPDPNGAWVWSAGFQPMSTEDAAEVVRVAAALHEPTGNPFLDLCISKGRFPSRMAQFCTEELKTLPIVEHVVLPMLKAGPVLQWLGIRADESANRAKQPRFNRHESGSMVWRPIFDWSVEQVWAQHRRHGIAPNPLYALGMGRVGCMPCINCRKSELRNIADLFPDHIDRIRKWEEIVASANKRRSATFFPAVTDPTDVDRPGSYSRIDTLVEWSRTPEAAGSSISSSRPRPAAVAHPTSASAKGMQLEPDQTPIGGQSMQLITAERWLERYFEAGSRPSVQVLQRLLREGKIPGRKVGGTWFIDEHEWLAAGDDLVASVLAKVA